MAVNDRCRDVKVRQIEMDFEEDNVGSSNNDDIVEIQYPIGHLFRESSTLRDAASRNKRWERIIGFFEGCVEKTVLSQGTYDNVHVQMLEESEWRELVSERDFPTMPADLDDDYEPVPLKSDIFDVQIIGPMDFRERDDDTLDIVMKLHHMIEDIPWTEAHEYWDSLEEEG